jgi:hypothetical protein
VAPGRAHALSSNSFGSDKRRASSAVTSIERFPLAQTGKVCYVS